MIFSTKSSKKIRSLDSDLKERIKNAIEELSNDPWENGTVKVKGHVDVRVAYVLFCKMILRPCTQHIFGKKEDTEPWKYSNC